LKGLAVEATFSAHSLEPNAENCQRFAMMVPKTKCCPMGSILAITSGFWFHASGVPAECAA
jgi:hypothetical protein